MSEEFKEKFEVNLRANGDMAGGCVVDVDMTSKSNMAIAALVEVVTSYDAGDAFKYIGESNMARLNAKVSFFTVEQDVEIVGKQMQEAIDAYKEIKEPSQAALVSLHQKRAEVADKSVGFGVGV